VCRQKPVEQLRNIGIINSTTRLHLVGSFYEIYITMHGSTNIRFILHISHPRLRANDLEGLRKITKYLLAQNLRTRNQSANSLTKTFRHADAAETNVCKTRTRANENIWLSAQEFLL